jgi:hypothetical protein
MTIKESDMDVHWPAIERLRTMSSTVSSLWICFRCKDSVSTMPESITTYIPLLSAPGFDLLFRLSWTDPWHSCKNQWVDFFASNLLSRHMKLKVHFRKADDLPTSSRQTLSQAWSCSVCVSLGVWCLVLSRTRAFALLSLITMVSSSLRYSFKISVNDGRLLSWKHKLNN